MKADSFTFSCPACGQHIAASASDVGANAACPSCNAELVVPDQTVTETLSCQKARRGHRSPLLVPLVMVSALLVVAVAALMLYIASKAGDRKSRVPGAPEATEVSGWQNDWGEFTKFIPNRVADKSLIGTTVRWTGKITKIDADRYWGRVSLEMPAPLEVGAPENENLRGKTRQVTTALSLDGKKWEAWKKLKVGDTVQFEGVLDKGNHEGVISFLYLTRRDTGEASLMVGLHVDDAMPLQTQ